MEETREQRRERESLQERYLATLVFEACQELDDSLVLQKDEREGIFLTKKAGKDTVTASLSRRGGTAFTFRGGWAAIEFGTSVYEVSPKNWFRLASELYASKETRDKQAKALPKKIVKVLKEVASAVEDFRAREALKKMADENKIEAVKKALSGTAKVVQGYGSRAEAILPRGRRLRIEQTYDDSFNVWTGTVRVNKEGLAELMEVLNRVELLS